MNKLSKEDVLALYSFLYEYETDIKIKVDHYHADDKSLKQFLQQYNIFIGALGGKSSRTNYFRCDMRRGRKASHSDLCHHIFRHIRNAIAHGLFQKDGKSFIAEDYHNSISGLAKSAEMRIETKLFWQFVEELKKTYV